MYIVLAISKSNSKEWYIKRGLNSKRIPHRQGTHPAQIYANGDKYWYVNGMCTGLDLNQNDFPQK